MRGLVTSFRDLKNGEIHKNKSKGWINNIDCRFLWTISLFLYRWLSRLAPKVDLLSKSIKFYINFGRTSLVLLKSRRFSIIGLPCTLIHSSLIRWDQYPNSFCRYPPESSISQFRHTVNRITWLQTTQTFGGEQAPLICALFLMFFLSVPSL